ncbi:MAG: deoxyribose-phosphate aldolase [Candidatus Bathyarchaeia archaeon]
MSTGKWTVERVAKTIDHTILYPYASEDDIRKLCNEAIEYGFAAVCINPIYIPLAYQILRNTEVRVCTVVGFPLGSTFKEVKVEEARRAVKAGAMEVDMVINIPMLKSRKYDYVEEEIREVKEAVGDGILKVIIECCYLTDEEKVTAAKIVERAGADYVKTSTGFGPSGAKIEDVKLLRSVLSPRMKIKAAGGIRTGEQALSFLEAGADRLGTSSGTKIIEDLKKILSQ